MVDLHVHTNFSFDGGDEPEGFITRAREYEDFGIGFSEHYDYDVVLDGQTDQPLPDLDEYFSKMDELKKSSPIKVYAGLELGYRKEAEDRYNELLETQPIDYAIMSVHTIEGRGDCYFPEFFDGLDKKQAYELYLNAILESLNGSVEFQILGHLGYIARYAPYEDKSLTYDQFPDLVDAILKKCIERGVCLEINGSANGLDSKFVTDISILERYIELGGRDFTYGSDAHTIAEYGRKRAETKNFLTSHNITYTSIFSKKSKMHMDIVR